MIDQKLVQQDLSRKGQVRFAIDRMDAEEAVEDLVEYLSEMIKDFAKVKKNLRFIIDASKDLSKFNGDGRNLYIKMVRAIDALDHSQTDFEDLLRRYKRLSFLD